MYKPGRKFHGILMPKGKGSDKRAPKPYLREQREPVLVAPGKVEMRPVSRQKTEKFLKEQCEELKDLIVETDESRFLGHVHKEKKVEEVEEKVEEVEEKVEEEELEKMVEEEIEEIEEIEEEEEIEEIEEIEDVVMEEDFEIMDISDDASIPEDDKN